VHGAVLHSTRGLSELIAKNVRAILLDVEGTTTPIEFVQRVLFPYARTRIHDYLRAHASDPEMRADVALLKSERAAEPAGQSDLPSWQSSDDLASAETYAYWLMDRDRKSTGLKSLQGRIWEEGYREGELRGKSEVYPDVAPALRRWRDAGKTIAIFSSGSVQAQRNLFANTTVGDLSQLLSNYFDTRTGPKREARSYTQIARALGHVPREVLFVSDVSAELDAARQAGMRTALCVRGTEPAQSDHPRVRTLAELA
jgi:enolase-phosphatase E1